MKNNAVFFGDASGIARVYPLEIAEKLRASLVFETDHVIAKNEMNTGNRLYTLLIHL